ncbi:MAG: hypothetical protein Q4C78_02610 [Synergistaceae bacterium]|nr:hypothetical protein [Synergistaceae bacterium]
MAVTTTRTITLGFLDNNADPFRVSFGKVKDLTDAAGKALVNAAMDAIIINQPYTKELAAKQSAYQTQTTKTDIELS